ncbi:hypothetical protein L6452_13472 [Arctium lappa]|uniref:Uncharacterized protein n=1 Tax=Arctium lappa TaxID=4217 RepID=A0ACB9CI77_ARCLA|nr:hypothetical protein L6452_13472 [Arctium lappa]
MRTVRRFHQLHEHLFPRSLIMGREGARTRRTGEGKDQISSIHPFGKVSDRTVRVGARIKLRTPDMRNLERTDKGKKKM